MSLTRELQNPNSIISKYLYKIIDPVESRILLHHWNTKLADAHTLKLSSDVNPALVGTAFDYAFRWTVADKFIDEDNLIGMMGARKADDKGYRYHVAALSQLIEKANITPHLRAPVSIILSWYERIIREGNFKPVLSCFKSKSVSVNHTIQMLTTNVPVAEIVDVQQLMNTIPKVWGKRLSKKMVLNPILHNSKYVGGADADWIIDGILYDCKCSWKSAPFTVGHLRQVMAYALLDWDNKFDLRGIGWYYARQQMLIEYPLQEIIPDIGSKRAELKTLYTTPVVKTQQIDLNQLNAELNDILWKHHGHQIEDEQIHFGWD